ncbi:FliM/FliN family flagellar motor C-terminal domain-containing protein [Vibrio maritimus]|uniref:FliM/FliN family flagellar motor C-terminal domain-containing protein n=1 Tax=Vibrio maritimus TaxID=990268 RepID=UPI0037367F37
MEKILLTEFGNPNVKMRKFLLKHTSHFSNEVIDLFKFNFAGRHTKVTFSQASDYPENSVKSVLNIEEFGNIFFYIEPQNLDVLLHRHLSSDTPEEPKHLASSASELTQTHLRLFQKFSMALANTMTADAKHYLIDNTDHEPSNVGVRITFHFDHKELSIVILIDDRYVKKLREMLGNNETFDRDEILNTLRYQPVEMGCVLLHGQCTLHELSKLVPGDVLPLTLCKNLTVKVNGHPTFFGKLQTIDSELGVKIDG